MRHLQGHTFQVPITAASAGTDVTLVAAVTGKRILVVGFKLHTNAQANFTFKSASTALTGALFLAVDGHTKDRDPIEGLFYTAKGEALVLSRSATCIPGGYLTYKVTD